MANRDGSTPGAPRGSKSGRKRLPEEERLQISERLRALIRAAPESTQAALARSLGIPANTVAGWLSSADRVHTPDTYTLHSMGRRRKVSADWVLFQHGEMFLAVNDEERILRALESMLIARGESNTTELSALLTPDAKQELVTCLYSKASEYIRAARSLADEDIEELYGDLELAVLYQQAYK
jgi:hypothetical protein